MLSDTTAPPVEPETQGTDERGRKDGGPMIPVHALRSGYVAFFAMRDSLSLRKGSGAVREP
jgi:hypothetical protein